MQQSQSPRQTAKPTAQTLVAPRQSHHPPPPQQTQTTHEARQQSDMPVELMANQRSEPIQPRLEPRFESNNQRLYTSNAHRNPSSGQRKHQRLRQSITRYDGRPQLPVLEKPAIDRAAPIRASGRMFDRRGRPLRSAEELLFFRPR